ncbi:VOC family protein [Sorangium sp. So ce887]|uniref:VOC family protein n=1 Tax=Sorangium sp. So ce887 TaxID=3133324 RepID=UPI003F5EC213
MSGFGHIRHGIGAVRPYVFGHLDLTDFVKRAFGAVELERQQMGPDSFHVELQIDDSVVVLETGEPRPANATVASIYVYVDDVDAAYARALQFGAVSIAAPEDKPYDERAAGVKDSFGNIWWISTYKRSGGS